MFRGIVRPHNKYALVDEKENIFTKSNVPTLVYVIEIKYCSSHTVILCKGFDDQ